MWPLREQLPGRFHTADAGHVEVHEHDVRVSAGHHLECLLARRRLTHYVHVGVAEDSAQALAKERVVVHNDDAEARHGVTAWGTGMCTRTSVPPLGRGTISKLPPSSETRCSIDHSPMPRDDMASKPRPSSATTMSSASTTRTVMRQRVAPEWRATFVSASPTMR